MHFGVLLGWSVVQSIVLWFIVNQIASNEAAEHRALDLYSCCCIMGYGMVPLLLLSVAVLLLPRWVGGWVGELSRHTPSSGGR
jgi:amino acid transporter